MIRKLTQIASREEYVLYPDFGDFFFDADMPQNCPVDGPKAHYGPRHATAQMARRFWTATDLERQLGGVDVIHANNYWCPRQLRDTRLVYTLYDLGFLQEPSWTTETNREGCFQGVFSAAVAADWVVAISQATKAHFLEVFPFFPSDRIKVIYPGSRFHPASSVGNPPAGLSKIQPGKFWLSVGTLEPRKNQDRLVEAYAAYVAAGGEPMPLVLAGGRGWLMDDFAERLDRLGIADHVIRTGYVSDDVLAWLYRNCCAHIYFSLFEGFGLPVIEGMTFGAPTIASNTTSIPEITGTAAILLAPTDVVGLTGAMLRISIDRTLRDAFSAKGRERAGAFEWERSAGQLLELYRLALEWPKRRPEDNSGSMRTTREGWPNGRSF